MKQILKKLTSLTLSIIIVLSVITITPFSANAVVTDSETVGAARFEYDLFGNGGTARIRKYNGTDTDLVIPSELGGHDVAVICDEAFYECESLKSVTIPETMKVIGKYAFYKCTSLTSITIPENVTSILDYAFSDCTSLNTLNFNAINCKDFSGNKQFYNCSSLTTVNIGDNVKRIPAYAFYSVEFESATIPENVTSIGNRAFMSCTSLKTLNFNAVNCADFTNDPNKNPFYGCYKLTTVNIGDKVERIPAYAFYDRKSLTSITIPENVKSIGDKAFAFCTELETLDFNAVNCADFSSDNPFYNCFTTTVNIGDKVERIPAYAFDDLNFESITIPESVTSIGNFAFRYCTYLKSITIPDSVTSIGNSAFIYCKSLESVTIPDSVTSISDSMFEGCTSLESVTIPNSIKSIGEGAFRGCSGITSIVIPDSVKTLGDYAFENCSSLEDVVIGNGIRTFDYSKYSKTFFGCSMLQSASIGKGVIAIADKTFGYYYYQGNGDNIECAYIYGFIIKGYPNTAAERYAKENDFTFIPIEEPITKPTQPTTKPTQPTTVPTTKPTQPTTVPTTKPTQPTTEPTEPTTKPTQPTTVPTTVPATQPTTVPATQPSDRLTVNVNSNVFPAETKTIYKSQKTVTVCFKLTSSMNILDGEWNLSYDNTKLKIDESKNQNIMPVVGDSGFTNIQTPYIYGNFSNINGYDFTTNKTFVSVTFDVIGTGNAEVDLYIDSLAVGSVQNFEFIVASGEITDISSIKGFENAKLSDLKAEIATGVILPDVVKGDVNGDGSVNAKDRMMLTRYLAMWSGYENIDMTAADVNSDGAVNAKDRMILTRHLAKRSGYETLR